MNWDWRLCLVADVQAASGRSLIEIVSDAVEAGVTCVQLRAKNQDGGVFLETARSMEDILFSRKIPLLINDRVDVAASCRCQGVHLGQKDLPIHHARRILGENAVIGISVNSLEEARCAEEEGADYVGAGPVFPTFSKETSYPVLGTEGLRRLRKQINIPILAIGGINPNNAHRVFESGADGIAVISAIMGRSDIKAAVRALARTLPPQSKT